MVHKKMDRLNQNTNTQLNELDMNVELTKPKYYKESIT